MDDLEDERELKQTMLLHSPSKLPYVVHKRKNSSNYWMRFSLRGHGQQRFGLGTDDLAEAYVIAAEKYQEAVIKAQHGILEGKTSFDKLAKQYIESLFKEAEGTPNRLSNARYAKRIYVRYLHERFKRKTINSIGVPQLYSYIEWRTTYWTDGPGKDVETIEYDRGAKTGIKRPAVHSKPSLNTLKREANVLRGIFKFAVRKGYLKSGDVPQLELGKGVKKKRPAFTREQFHKLLVVSERRIKEAAKDPKLRYQRYLLHNFMIIAVETGLRTKELFKLNWGHVEGFRQRLMSDSHARAHTWTCIDAYKKWQFRSHNYW